MDVIVCNAYRANRFKPKVPTAVMRIWSGNQEYNEGYLKRLKYQERFVKVFDYTFDDVTPEDFIEKSKVYPGIILFDKNIARQMIRDFNSVRNNIECLLAHCMAGIGRSPSVTMALNDGYHLGEWSFLMSLRYPHHNRFVYDLLLREIRLDRGNR